VYWTSRGHSEADATRLISARSSDLGALSVASQTPEEREKQLAAARPVMTAERRQQYRDYWTQEMRAAAADKSRARWEDDKWAARAVAAIMDPAARAQARATCVERYGVEHWLASEAAEKHWRSHPLSDGTATNAMHIAEFVRKYSSVLLALNASTRRRRPSKLRLLSRGTLHRMVKSSKSKAMNLGCCGP
jgi:hypothetical protein